MDQTDLNELAKLADDLAQEAQTIASDRFGHAAVSQKTDGSDVTDADLAIQDRMTERIGAAYPDHLVVGEETTGSASEADCPRSSQYCWVIDPIDGTRNYVRGVPLFSTAIAVLEHGLPVVGLIRSLTTGDVYSAVRGGGTRWNSRPVHLEARLLGASSMVAVQSTIRDVDAGIAGAVSGMAVLRNLGSTALHLALTAIGACDGTIARESKLWDLAAGALLVTEAGGVCTDWSGSSPFPVDVRGYKGEDMPFVAAPPGAHEELLTRIQERLDGRGS